MHCGQCGNQLVHESAFCPTCGTKVDGTAPDKFQFWGWTISGIVVLTGTAVIPTAEWASLGTRWFMAFVALLCLGFGQAARLGRR